MTSKRYCTNCGQQTGMVIEDREGKILEEIPLCEYCIFRSLASKDWWPYLNEEKEKQIQKYQRQMNSETGGIP